MLTPLSKGVPTTDLSKFFTGFLSDSNLTSLFSAASSVVSLVASGSLLLIVVLFLLMSPGPIVRSLLSGIPERIRPVVQRNQGAHRSPARQVAAGDGDDVGD
ncbi:MAG: hypothetical protein IVW51_14210 [Thermaceae bacterium]|nr:hypothetical protein [Thermaceae bacterium]